MDTDAQYDIIIRYYLKSLHFVQYGNKEITDFLHHRFFVVVVISFRKIWAAGWKIISTGIDIIVQAVDQLSTELNRRQQRAT